MPNAVVMLITAALSTLGFSILFYIHPRRLPVATLGGLLTTGVYLLAVRFIGGELLPTCWPLWRGQAIPRSWPESPRCPFPFTWSPA